MKVKTRQQHTGKLGMAIPSILQRILTTLSERTVRASQGQIKLHVSTNIASVSRVRSGTGNVQQTWKSMTANSNRNYGNFLNTATEWPLYQNTPVKCVARTDKALESPERTYRYVRTCSRHCLGGSTSGSLAAERLKNKLPAVNTEKSCDFVSRVQHLY